MSKKDTSLKPGDSLQRGDLFPFDAHYKWNNKTFSTTIWAKSFAEADKICSQLKMKNAGQIVGVYPD